MPDAVAFIGLGANLGDPVNALRQAVQAITALPGVSHLQVSPFYRSDPVDAPGPAYVNAVARIETTRPPQALLAAMQEIETALGRRRSFRNAPRTLDLDLLWQDGVCLDSPTLTLPHPRMHLRAFVLKPLLTLPGGDVMLHGQPASSWMAQCVEQHCVELTPRD